MHDFESHPYQNSLERCDVFCKAKGIRIYYREMVDRFNMLFVVDDDKKEYLKSEFAGYFPSYVHINMVTVRQVFDMNKALKNSP